MRPKLKPAARRAWRSDTTMQFWRAPERAMVLSGIDEPLRALLDSLDGSHTTEGWVALAARRGVAEARARRLLHLLQEAALVEDAGELPDELRGLPFGELDRLHPELAALSVTRPAAAGALARRRAATVHVLGGGRLGAGVAVTLAAAGVGGLRVLDERAVTSGDVAVLGHRPDDLGRSRGAALAHRLRSDYPALRWGGPEPATVSVLCEPEPPDPAPGLVRRARVHLHAAVPEGAVVVGPFVLPGASPCGRCLDLTRAARDDGWAAVAATAPGDCAAAIPVTLASALAAREVLEYVDGGEPASLSATLEVVPAGWRARRRAWRAHPDCPCRAARD